MTSPERIAVVRSFNRFWTRRIGALDSVVANTPYTLTEGRVLFELTQSKVTAMADLRERLGLDAGHLSRVISRLRDDALIESRPDDDDARRQMLRLTEGGWDAHRLIEERCNSKVGDMLGAFPLVEQDGMVGAMTTIQEIAGGPMTQEITLRRPVPGELGWVVQRHGSLYAREMGWDVTFEALVARLVGDFATDHDETTERAWIADLGGAPVGSIFCVRADDKTARLRMLLVEPAVRGRGVGNRLVAECVAFARRVGYRRMVLWTNDLLTGAARLYQAAGFVLVREEPDDSFTGAPVAQTWALEL